MEATVLQLAAAVAGLFVGTFLFSRVGNWIQAIVTAVNVARDEQGLPQKPVAGHVALAAILNSGPWLLAGVLYWAYYVLSAPHMPAWDWFFATIAAAVPIWLAILIFMHRRNKRTKEARGQNAV